MCSLLFYLSICVAMVDAHKVEQGQRVCPRSMVVFDPNSVCLFNLHFLVGSQG